MPLYVSTDGATPDKHDLRSSFALPKDQKDKFVTFYDDCGLELIPKGMVQVIDNVGSGGNTTEYAWRNNKGDISIYEATSPSNSMCFSTEWSGTSKDRKETGCYPPKHIRYVKRTKDLIIAEQYHVKHPELMTTIIVGNAAEVDITLPKKDKKLSNTLVRYYTQWIKNWYDNQ